ncbi:pyridoxal phosphate-dependent decarboxylase family protein [Muricoccus pecuniae]|uniref:Glutamate/tyrosine decarboxylase-like PLP-dependent enzyme n=1 Tax=Muricoccus pecuniae TaxID=693023 RepID=A0A840Y713_9PROT|nr:pyridoxal-dependent decarboxylase [Roseomonas pecuniae]MBB5696525.1 glutamate/tyrosine decarboxylase-like PLP-dependent enzyme [Roseomonas pecuniae]
MAISPKPETDELARVLRTATHAAISFRQALPEGAQRPEANYAAMRRAFDRPLPEVSATDHQALIEDLAARAAPGLHATTGPRFFGWVIGASHPVGVAADWLTSAWGQNAGNHEAAPAAAAAETTAARWLLELLDLPSTCSVGFVTGATVANLVCLAAARSAVLRAAGWDVEADGLEGAPSVRVLIGDDAHTTVFLALQVLGFGHRRVTRIATDAAGRMQADLVAAALAKDSGPSIVVAQAGQINTGAFDPFASLSAAVACHPRAWLHVDGAFGLWARASHEKAHLAQGIDLADSWATDGHKWLQTPYDSGYAIVRDTEVHRRAMTAAASYLPAEAEGERDPSRYVPELSRRARGFATWAMIRALGRQGIAEMVERHCALAQRFAAALATEPGIRILNEVELNQIIVRFGTDEELEQGDTMTKEVVARLQQEGVLFAGGAQWRGRTVLRLSVISWPTTEKDVDLSAQSIIEVWREVKRRDDKQPRTDSPK